jgi:hypothetical protein
MMEDYKTDRYARRRRAIDERYYQIIHAEGLSTIGLYPYFREQAETEINKMSEEEVDVFWTEAKYEY